MFPANAIVVACQLTEGLLRPARAASNTYVGGRRYAIVFNVSGSMLTGKNTAVSGWKRKIRPQASAWSL